MLVGVLILQVQSRLVEAQAKAGDLCGLQVCKSGCVSGVSVRACMVNEDGQEGGRCSKLCKLKGMSLEQEELKPGWKWE